MTFAQKIKQLRKSHNLTQENLANIISVSRTLITKYESGAIYPTEDNLKRLADYFHVEVSYLISDEEKTTMTLNAINWIHTFKKILVILALILSIFIMLFLLLPVFRYGHYVYPIPEGQNKPNYIYGVTSLMTAHLKKNNILAILSFIIALMSAAFSYTRLFINKKYIKILALIFIILAILLFILTIFNGISIIQANDFQLNGRIEN